MKKHLSLVMSLLFPFYILSQNIGISTTSPLEKLQVGDLFSDPGSNYIMVGSPGNNTSVSGIKLRHFSDDYGFTIESNDSLGSQGLHFRRHVGPGLRFSDMFINSSGNVGIGITSPSAKLEVEGEIKADSLDIQSGLIKNVADPISAQDAATKGYVDGEISSLPTITTYSVGDFAQGGIVFWVDETGQHGLVCAKSDQSSGIRWYAGTYGNTQAKGDGPYSGEANTAIIIAAQVAIGDDGSTYAARICNELQITEGGTTYGDWYLPSKYELDLMYGNKATIDATALANGGVGFAAGYYWSSTEIGYFLTAWGQNFGTGFQDDSIKNSNFDVRAVRAF